MSLQTIDWDTIKKEETYRDNRNSALANKTIRRT